MAAFNWIRVNVTCPACFKASSVRCQTHIASDFRGDGTGRFQEREYNMGDQMAWWPRGDERFDQWRANRHDLVAPEPDFDEEACYATCELCGSQLYVVIRFHETVPERIVAVGKEEEWPDGYSR